MKLRNKITEDINKRNKPYLMLFGLNAVMKCVIQKNFSSAEGEKSEKSAVFVPGQKYINTAQLLS